MKISTTILVCILISSAICGSTYLLLRQQFKKVAVVDAVKLFDGFNMKKELEQKAKVKLQREAKRLDSFENGLKMIKAKGNKEEITRMTYACSYAKSILEDQYKQSNHDINEQVWKRLNAITEHFGNERGLHLIVGANGMGSVLYVDRYYDVTNELIEYSNKKYEEGN